MLDTLLVHPTSPRQDLDCWFVHTNLGAYLRMSGVCARSAKKRV